MQNIFKIVEHVLLNPNIKASDIAVFFALFSRMGKKGYCYPSVETIVKETGYSERTVQLSTNRLEKEGYISKVYRKSHGKQYSNYYCLQAGNFECHTNTKDAELKEIIYEQREFQKFIDKYSVEVDYDFKLATLTFVERKLQIDKRENTFLMYAILMSDKEACIYFTVEKLAKKLSMATSRVKGILASLVDKGLINLIKKNVRGMEICLMRINIELLNNSAIIKEKINAIIGAKKQAKITFFIFLETNINELYKVEKMTIIVFFNHWLMIHYKTAQMVIHKQMIGRHNLFYKVFAP